MATGVQDWSTTAGSNASADSNVNWSEGQLGPTVNNSARGMMASIKAWANTIGGGVTYGGAGNAYTITNDAVGAWSSLAAPRLIMLKANHTNTGASTVAVDGLTATAIRKNGTTALASGDIVSGGLYLLAYDGTVFQIIGNFATLSSYQPLDATLTALAALSISSGKIIKGTGSDTFSLIDVTSFGESVMATASEATFKALVNLEAGVDYQAYDADTLKSDLTATLSAGYLSDSYSGGTISSGTYTPAPQTGQENFQHYTNGGAHTLAPPASVCAVVVEILNNGSAGAVTTSGFTKVSGDPFTTTNGHKFLAHITKSNSYSHLHVTALQ